MSEWLTIECERALYVDRGRETVLCDRLPSPITLVVKLTAQAIEARSAATGTGAVEDESAVAESDAPTPSTHPGERP
jgi:hypothetical protein